MGAEISVSARVAAAMGNHHSASNSTHRTRKNVHWKSAGRPTPPGKPDIIPILSDDEPNAITLRWAPAIHDGGAPLRGYQVECNRLGSADWVRTAPPVVLRPELVLTGLDPPHRYQFRVAAVNAVGRSEYSELSDVLTVNSDRPSSHEPPLFLQHLEDVVTLENDKTEFRATFTGSPTPTIAWFKDDYEIFSSRRTAISTTESTSVLVFHQTLPSDEGEIKCTATNRVGHAVTKARLSLEAAPKLRYPRQYEDGLLYEINETVLLKTTIVGKPTPTIEWRHDGQPISVNDRVQITNTSKFSMLKIHSARRSDRGEYQVQAKNNIGEDTAAFLVTITAPPNPPRNVSVTRQVDKSVTLDWEPPEDDGGCRIGNYVVEYYRSGWNVWLKATTSRKTNVTLFDLIEGSEYKFRVKAESPYGMSAPSAESDPIKIPGRSVDMEFLAVESRIINDVLVREDGEEVPISPVPRRKRALAPPNTTSTSAPVSAPVTPVLRKQLRSPSRDSASTEYMLVLYPENNKTAEKAEKRKSFQLDLEDALSPPPISISAPELSSRQVVPFKPLRHAVSSTELLHERAMARFYKVAAMREERSKTNYNKVLNKENNHIPNHTNDLQNTAKIDIPEPKIVPQVKIPEVFVKTDSVESKDSQRSSDFINNHEETDIPQKLGHKWQSMSFDEDYTASTVSTDGDYSEDDGSLNEDEERATYFADEEETYNPRDKVTSSLSVTSLDKGDNLEVEQIKLLPLPDPNFVPKPILKKKGTDIKDANLQNSTVKNISEIKNEKVVDKSKKDEKLTLFKKFTKMPVQNPFSRPKIHKKESNKSQDDVQQSNDKKVTKNVTKNKKDDLNDEGKTVIDYYGNIVKEYGRQRPNTPLYLNTEDLKKVAENQEIENFTKKENVEVKKVINKTPSNKVNKKQKENNAKPETKQQLNKQTKPILKKLDNAKVENNNKLAPKPKTVAIREEKPKVNINNSKVTEKTQVVLTTTERATIVIPIDYKKLEEKAKMNVRTAIHYTVDVCLLLLAFWVYLFKDERLAIPFLILIIYRQLQETIATSVPDWFNRYTPQWLKKKSS